MAHRAARSPLHLLGREPGADNACQCRMDLGDQTPDPVQQSGGSGVRSSSKPTRTFNSARVSSPRSGNRGVWGMVRAASMMMST